MKTLNAHALEDTLPDCLSIGPAKAYGVDYQCFHFREAGDLYVTRYGLPYLNYLSPHKWYDHNRYCREGKRQLDGIGHVYRVPVISDKNRKMDLVVKFSRFAQRTTLYTASFLPEGLSSASAQAAHVNNPFEEFGLLFKLRRYAKRHGVSSLLTKRPLAIFSPNKRYKPNLLDRSDWRFNRCLESLRLDQKQSTTDNQITLDISRMYILLFQWVKGENAWNLFNQGILSKDEMMAITNRVKNDLAQASFRVLDHKPQHIILRRRRDRLVSRGGHPSYALVDFELLEFRPELV